MVLSITIYQFRLLILGDDFVFPKRPWSNPTIVAVKPVKNVRHVIDIIFSQDSNLSPIIWFQMKVYYIKASKYVKIPKAWHLIYSITRKDASTLRMTISCPAHHNNEYLMLSFCIESEVMD